MIYELCPKSNETGVIKTLLKYTKVKFLQSNLSFENTFAFAFSTIQNILGRHFLRSFLSSVVAAILMESMSEKRVPFRTDLILGKRKKSHGARSGEYGECSKSCNVSFCEKLTNTQGCVSRSVIVVERQCVGFPKAPLLVTY